MGSLPHPAPTVEYLCCLALQWAQRFCFFFCFLIFAPSERKAITKHMCTDCRTISAKFFHSVCRMLPLPLQNPSCQYSLQQEALLVSPFKTKPKAYSHFAQKLVSDNSLLKKHPKTHQSKNQRQNKNSPKAKNENKTLIQ